MDKEERNLIEGIVDNTIRVFTKNLSANVTDNILKEMHDYRFSENDKKDIIDIVQGKLNKINVGFDDEDKLLIITD